MDIEELKKRLEDVRDPRRESGNYRHKLVDIIVIALCTIMVGGEDYVDMEDFGREREEWLGVFLELVNGIPDSDTFRRVFERLDSIELSTALTQWLDMAGNAGGRTVNIDGKTIRGSASGNHSALHVVSAWVHENEISLGEVATDKKSNEITAIPELLELIDVEGDLITIDAMGCQTEIAKKIIEKKADYVLALKDNQPTMHEGVRDYFTWLEAEHPREEKYSRWDSGFEKGHGRIERRIITAITNLEWLDGREKWPDLRSIVQYKCIREINGKSCVSERYYISSFDADAQAFAYLLRNHWSIENRLHWMLDVVFREDDGKAKKENSPLNLNVLRKIAMARLKAADPNKRIGTRKKMLKAALNPDYLLRAFLQG